MKQSSPIVQPYRLTGSMTVTPFPNLTSTIPAFRLAGAEFLSSMFLCELVLNVSGEAECTPQPGNFARALARQIFQAKRLYLQLTKIEEELESVSFFGTDSPNSPRTRFKNRRRSLLHWCARYTCWPRSTRLTISSGCRNTYSSFDARSSASPNSK